MRTVRCSGHVMGRCLQWGVSAQGDVCQGGVSNHRVCVCPGECGCTPPPLDRILDTRLWKHYLFKTSFEDGNNEPFFFTILTSRWHGFSNRLPSIQEVFLCSRDSCIHRSTLKLLIHRSLNNSMDSLPLQFPLPYMTISLCTSGNHNISTGVLKGRLPWLHRNTLTAEYWTITATKINTKTLSYSNYI